MNTRHSMSVRKSRTFVGFGILAIATAMAGAAWACTPQANTSLLPEAGGPGTPVFITGNSFGTAASSFAPSMLTPVEIRWNSIDGPVLGTANGPNFSISVNVPGDAPSGVAYLVAVQKDGDGNVLARVTRSFIVSAAQQTDKSTVTGDLWRGLDPGRSLPTTSGGEGNTSRPGAAAGLGLAALGMVMLATAAVVSGSRKAKASKI